MENDLYEEITEAPETKEVQNDPVSPETAPPKKNNNFIFILILLLIVAGGGLWFWKKEEAKKEAVAKTTEMPPVVVSDMVLKASDFPVTLEYTGQTKGFREAEVRAQVGGVLKSKEYREGQPVKAGQVLFRIDPAPYRATLNRNSANLKQAQVQADLAKIEFDRISSLYSKNAVSKNDLDNADATYKASKAAVDSARAAVRQSQIDLDWTVVRAPISGLSSKEERSIGNLITLDAQGSLLTTIVQADPVYVEFAVPADEHRINEMLRSAGHLRVFPDGISVKVALGDGTFYDKKGKIDFQDQFVDPSTADIRARAVFDNPGNRLYPGQFVRVYVDGNYIHNVISIPLRSVLQTSSGPIVYVLDDANVPAVRNIKIIKTIKNTCLIEEGLKEGERIVVDGVAKILPGKAVKISEKQEHKAASGDKTEGDNAKN
ncbi:MAG: efflux RND transporter periplasmic adaptor subunit [Synergistaceae bacterium]|jgi:membrane fusion protein (multidrug efflux system)|nr:efflux RND transporter periplasmic adaptor subunit [Synergistaceae bacterium]MDD2349834.1 efflux RND transporter periplasmic adaptor subunit [Synergistaceae bacterium]MDD3319407.1 efflux RND transporter periplasmic adaptor subunit [Synergistaceae bacterium]MDD3672926.1 efflux RND transporter periplasmic adaptor subunit [Synergistaceae bacterium]MDD3962934.1 efflux RND transporter periplasmic adaptor subunit [Synergistaceae bacterium]